MGNEVCVTLLLRNKAKGSRQNKLNRYNDATGA